MIRRDSRSASSLLQSLFRVCAAAWIAMSAVAYGDEKNVWRIEEDWEMVIYEPDPSIYSPQVTFFTSPRASDDNTYFQLQMNYAADQSFSAGGFHVAAVSNGTIVDEERSRHRITLATSNDQISWTSVMAVWEGSLVFAVKDGHGQEWGDFGGPEYLVRILPSPVNRLNEYQHSHSLNSVDIGFGANRVEKVCLRRVRLYYTDGSMKTEEVNAETQR